MRNGQKDNGTLSGDYLGTRSFKGYRHKTESKPLMKRTTTSQDTQVSSSCSLKPTKTEKVTKDV